jgi:soluble lytic murein transglycosylase-like protein
MSNHRAPAIPLVLARHVARAFPATGRWLVEPVPRWQGLAVGFAAAVVTGIASVLIATASGGRALRLPLGEGVVSAASELSGAAGQLPGRDAHAAATAEARMALQDGYATEPGAVAPAAELEAAPAGAPLPAWIPPTVARWEPNIRAATSRYGVDPALVAIIVTVESAGNPNAGSHAGAQGLMQVVARWHPRILEGAGPFDPDHNLDVGTAFLADLLRQYAVPGDEANGWQATVERAAAAFNGGPGGVTNPVAETRHYVRWVGGMWRERDDATSPTFESWIVAGGRVALDIAVGQEAMAR